MTDNDDLKDLLYQEHLINKELLDLKMEMQVLGVQMRELGDRLYNVPDEILFAGETAPEKTITQIPPLDIDAFVAGIKKLPQSVIRYRELKQRQKGVMHQRRVKGI